MNIYLKKILHRFNTLSYFLTPPIFPALYKKFVVKRKKVIKNDDSYISLLNDLESEGIGHFITDDMVKKFCSIKKEALLDSTRELHIDDENLQKNLDELNEEGFTVVKNVLSKVELEEINTEIIPLAEAEILEINKLRTQYNPRLTSKVVKKERNGLTALHNLYDGVIRIRPIEKLMPSIERLGVQSNIHKICKSYLGGTVSPGQFYLDIKGVLGASDSSVGLHGDSYGKICKAFIALEDITDENAPFLYFSRSHKQGKWRLFKDLLEFSNINSEYHDYFSMYNIISMFKVSEEDNGVDIKPKRVSIKAGDAIIADTHGIHGATDLLSGRRIQLGLTFASRGLGPEDKYISF